MTFVGDFPRPPPLRRAIEAQHAADETAAVSHLLAEAELEPAQRRRIAARARRLVEGMRRDGRRMGGLDAFMHEYGLSNEEGVVLMCLAEALLRIPDAETADRLIRDKIADADWERHLGHSESLLVNASTWALMLTGRVIGLDDPGAPDLGRLLGRMMAKSGEPVIREALRQAMRILGRQFVLGRTIQEALDEGREAEAKGYRLSYDMLGEAALTAADAGRYRDAYSAAIAAIGAVRAGRARVAERPGISVKLSALHPRFEPAQAERVMAELAPTLAALAAEAKAGDIGLCVDAEEADRLEPTLDVVEAVSADPGLAGWDGLGLAVQAYQKRSLAVVDWLADTARRHRRRLMVRLVKGAYWDTEIKYAQERGLRGYPVFTRKLATDVSYLACARRILANRDVLYPQFATHNAYTLAAVIEMAGKDMDFEVQRLHGMGEALHDQVVAGGVPSRIYAPVGSHEDLLAYLVRRLLENGANTSFVNRIADAALPVDEVIADPWRRLADVETKPHPRIPLPAVLYGAERRNAVGPDLADRAELRRLRDRMAEAPGGWRAAPIPDGGGRERPVLDPADRERRVGTVVEATAADVKRAAAVAGGAFPGWDATPAEDRSAVLDRAADAMEQAMPALMALAVREAGKTLADAVAEVREAVDFLRYYASRARADFARPAVMPGPTGERNLLELRGRGVFACISPWNFPLAIFTGQVAAALAAGNAVLAKPAEQTPLMAAEAVRILHAAGVSKDVLHLLPGDGPTVGAALVAEPGVAGVAFTGSVETAGRINRTLADRPGPIVPLIAETGGQNAMIVDSTALPEQVVADAVVSAFRSAGQRCSALRVLFVQEEIAGRVLDMLAGALGELRLGDPGLLATDVGPVIDGDALGRLEDHAARMERDGRLLARAPMGQGLGQGTFFQPRAIEIDRLDRLSGEVFGPILHVVRYPEGALDDVIAAVNGTGFGLTLGIHTRVDDTRDYVYRRARVGNTYVNRNMIGAVVGVQPFGGEGLSGTGPKAGGPRYLHRFAVERTLSVNTAATGGNAELLSLDDEGGG